VTEDIVSEAESHSDCREIPRFIEPEGSSLYSKGPATGHHPVTFEFSSRFNILLFQGKGKDKVVPMHN
jgi:hypothetical protein